MGNLKDGSDVMVPQTGNKGCFPKWGFLLIGVLAVLVLSVWLLWRKPSSGSGALPEVTVALVDTARVDVYCEYDGSIRASQSVEVTARVEGILEKMLFKEGSYVRKGQILFIIDPKLYQAQVDRAKAQLDRAKALEDKAKRDLNRIRPLYNQKAASQLDLDNAEAALECAAADVEICKVDLLEAQITLGYTR
ncbi:MAG: efflux RND transporter periplasmic adaptor subunit, partial [Muribaculaceae bacterium]|nr:efflux RND transporter periplasmic adaptor subunit [Muribaculaceae bacterium]